MNVEQNNNINEESPLVAIKKKEIEINTQILEASRKADEKISSARREAIKIKTKAEKNGLAEAKQLRKKEIEKAKKEAVKIERSSDGEIEKVTKQGKKNLNKAASYTVKAVIASTKT